MSEKRRILVRFGILVTGAFLQSCFSVDPFFEYNQREDWQPLEESTMLNEEEKRTLDQFMKEETFFDAAILLSGQAKVYSFGDVQLPINAASVRKSIFSALFGIAQEKGFIDIDMTLAELGIDDSKQPLTSTEKEATLRQLLQTRSGIYLKAGGETALMKERKPDRGTHKPGEHFYYNNWNFNVLPVILEEVTSRKVGDLIQDWVAVPTKMHSFNPENVLYDYFDYTEHPQTRIYLSAEDLSRIGALYIQNGEWDGETVIPVDWISESLAPASFQKESEDLLDDDFFEQYAMSWWIDQDTKTVWASGFGGQFMIIDRNRNFVLVLRNNIGNSVPGYLWNNATHRKESHEKGGEVYQLILNQL